MPILWGGQVVSLQGIPIHLWKGLIVFALILNAPIQHSLVKYLMFPQEVVIQSTGM